MNEPPPLFSDATPTVILLFESVEVFLILLN